MKPDMNNNRQQNKRHYSFICSYQIQMLHLGCLFPMQVKNCVEGRTVTETIIPGAPTQVIIQSTMNEQPSWLKWPHVQPLRWPVNSGATFINDYIMNIISLILVCHPNIAKEIQ